MKVYKLTQKRYWLNLAVLIALVAIVGYGSILHIRGNLANISDNRPITWLNSNNGAGSQNHRADVIFYRDSCPHCQKVIPYVYLTNKILSSQNHKIEYRDINKPVNRDIGSEVGDKDFPESKEITMHDGIQHAYQQPMIQASGNSPAILLVFYSVAFLCILVLLAMII